MSTTSTFTVSSTDLTTTTQGSNKISLETIIIIISVLGAVSIILTVILLCLCCRRNQAKRNITTSVKGGQSSLGASPAPSVLHSNRPPSIQEINESSRKPRSREHRLSSGMSASSGHSSSQMVSVHTTNSSAHYHPPSLIELARSNSADIDLNAPIPSPRHQNIPTISEQAEQSNDPGDYINANVGQFSSSSSRRPVPTPKDEVALDPLALPMRRISDRSQASSDDENLFRAGTKAHHLYCNAIQDYEMSREDVKFRDKLGKGHFGNVYAGVAAKLPHSQQTNKVVAIKTMRSSATDSDKQEFLYEYKIMKLTNTLNHPNITKLLGCVTKSQPCLIVLELMSNGNLRTFLRETRTQTVYYNLHGNSSRLTERQLLKFAYDIANGMEGLANLQLLHRDLAARNILLDDNMTCKIADFGFAKDVINKPQYKSKSVFQRPRPTRWLAPESLLLFKHSIQSDVWSYGITLWEIVTLGNLPYPKMKSAHQVQHAISQGYRMPCPKHCSPDIYRVMSYCWEEKPTDRPTFTEISAKMLELLQQADKAINMDKIEDGNDYIEVLPPDDQEICMGYASEETLE